MSRLLDLVAFLFGRRSRRRRSQPPLEFLRR